VPCYIKKKGRNIRGKEEEEEGRSRRREGREENSEENQRGERRIMKRSYKRESEALRDSDSVQLNILLASVSV